MYAGAKLITSSRPQGLGTDCATLLKLYRCQSGLRSLFAARPNTIPTLGVRSNQTIADSEINLNSIAMIGEDVESAAMVESRLCKKRLPNNSSNFSAEWRRILLALEMIVCLSTGSQLLFLSDYLSTLQSSKSRAIAMIGQLVKTWQPFFKIQDGHDRHL